jgi:hypothetical protein
VDACLAQVEKEIQERVGGEISLNLENLDIEAGARLTARLDQALATASSNTLASNRTSQRRSPRIKDNWTKSRPAPSKDYASASTTCWPICRRKPKNNWRGPPQRLAISTTTYDASEKLLGPSFRRVLKKRSVLFNRESGKCAKRWWAARPSDLPRQHKTAPSSWPNKNRNWLNGKCRSFSTMPFGDSTARQVDLHDSGQFSSQD